MKGQKEQSSTSLLTLSGLPGPLLTGLEVAVGATVTVCVALFLCWGFVPGSETLICGLLSNFQIPANQCQLVAFPLMALLFSLSSADPLPKPAHVDYKQVLRISVIPFIVAILYGALRSERQMLWQLGDPRVQTYFIWGAFCVPIGEELIFRKWLFSWIARWFQQKSWPDTNPLPVVIWLTALAFSLWHIQNIDALSSSEVIFQVVYTFAGGVWLGYLRWLTGRLWPCIVAHFLINAVS